FFFLFSSRRRHTRFSRDWSSDVCSSDLLSGPPTIEAVQRLLASSDGVRMVKKVLRKAKADRVGIAMADITVCGAVAPYSALLGRSEERRVGKERRWRGPRGEQRNRYTSG